MPLDRPFFFYHPWESHKEQIQGKSGSSDGSGMFQYDVLQVYKMPYWRLYDYKYLLPR